MQITIREPGSALTHYIAMLLSMIAATPLLIKSVLRNGNANITAMGIFALSMILLYGASALYHSVNLEGKRLRFFKKLDHMMIFVLIAGSYTPICMIILDDDLGYRLLCLVWSIALAGILIKAFWVTCPKWFSSLLYISMGWVCVLVFGELWEVLPKAAFLWLLIGGIIYTIGGIIYAMKINLFHGRLKYFGSHELFHLFVMGGSFCHFVFMYLYVC